MRYIHHITLTTGHLVARPRSEVTDETLAIMVPWLAEAIAIGRPMPIPAADGYQALALVQDGALVVTVYGPQPEVGRPDPVVTFGVTARSLQAPRLWDLLAAMPGVKPGLTRPDAPWCAVVVHLPLLLRHPAAAGWLGDFEHCTAWAWVTRTSDIQAVT